MEHECKIVRLKGIFNLMKYGNTVPSCFTLREAHSLRKAFPTPPEGCSARGSEGASSIRGTR